MQHYLLHVLSTYRTNNIIPVFQDISGHFRIFYSYALFLMLQEDGENSGNDNSPDGGNPDNGNFNNNDNNDDKVDDHLGDIDK